MTLLAVDRAAIADYVSALFTVYIILIIVRILLSWIPRMPYNRVLNAVVTFVHEVTDPYLNVFRRILPPVESSQFIGKGRGNRSIGYHHRGRPGAVANC